MYGTKLGTIFADVEDDEEGIALDDWVGSRAEDELLGRGSTGTVAREALVFVNESMVKNRTGQTACDGEGRK